MGLLEPHLAQDIDNFASELLRLEDPAPLELLARALVGAAPQGDGRISPHGPLPNSTSEDPHNIVVNWP